MIKVKHEDISSNGFEGALQKLARAPLTADVAMQISDTIDALNEARKKITKRFQDEVLAKFAKKNEAGEYDPKTIEEKDQEEYVKAVEAFGQLEIEVACEKLAFHRIAKAPGLSAVDMSYLNTLLDREIRAVPTPF